MGRALAVVAVLSVVAITAVVVVLVARIVQSPRGPTASGAVAADRFPQGVYRYRLSKADVLGVVPDIGADYLADAIGTFTWTLRNGVITLEQTGCRCRIPGVTGRYTIAGNRLTVRWPRYASNGVEFCSGDCVETVRWTFDGTVLRIDPLSVRGYDVVFWGANKPWQRIG